MGKHRRPSHCVELSASALSPLQTVIWFRKYPVFLKSGEGGGGDLHFVVSGSLNMKRIKRRVIRETQMN